MPSPTGANEAEHGLDYHEAVPNEVKVYLVREVSELSLSTRAANALKNGKILYLGDLVQLTQADLLRIDNLGRKSLNEIEEALAQLAHEGVSCASWADTVQAHDDNTD